MHKIGKGIVSVLALTGFVWLSIRVVGARPAPLYNETDSWILLGLKTTYFLLGGASVLYFIAWLFTESCGRSLVFHHWGADQRCSRCGKRRGDKSGSSFSRRGGF